MATVFEKMWDGKIKSNDLFRSEDLGIMATLDGYPATQGHTLIVPREPVDDWADVSTQRLAQGLILAKVVKDRMDDAGTGSSCDLSKPIISVSASL